MRAAYKVTLAIAEFNRVRAIYDAMIESDDTARLDAARAAMDNVLCITTRAELDQEARELITPSERG